MIQYELKDFDYALEDILKQTDLTIDALMFSKVYGTSNMTPQMAMECNEHFNFTIPVSSVKNGFSLSTRRIAMEGIVGSIIDKLKAFFRWIGEKLGLIEKQTSKLSNDIKQTKKDLKEVDSKLENSIRYFTSIEQSSTYFITFYQDASDKERNRIDNLCADLFTYSDSNVIELQNKLLGVIDQLGKTLPDMSNFKDLYKGAVSSMMDFKKLHEAILNKLKNNDEDPTNLVNENITDGIIEDDKAKLEKLNNSFKDIAITPELAEKRINLQKEFFELVKELDDLTTSKKNEYLKFSSDQRSKFFHESTKAIKIIINYMKDDIIKSNAIEDYTNKIETVSVWESALRDHKFNFSDHDIDTMFEGKINNEAMKANLAVFETRRKLLISMMKTMHETFSLIRKDSEICKNIFIMRAKYLGIFHGIENLVKLLEGKS